VRGLIEFDAILFDAGGVLVLPDPTVLGPLLAYYGADSSVAAQRRAHYAGMAAKSEARASETFWAEYNLAYVRSAGVPDDHLEHAADTLGRTRSAALWRWAIPESLDALARLHAEGVPMGVVSNASGQIEDTLTRSKVCQAGDGPYVPMRVIIDSHVVGVTKPDPAIFDFALVHFAEFQRDRILYVGDALVMDVQGARAAGLVPVLLDPYDDHDGADFHRIRSLDELLGERYGR
jgi:putative hydrolase of the HAD superfamily